MADGSGMLLERAKRGEFDVIVGGGTAAFCAALAAREQGAQVLVLERAGADEAGGSSRFTAGAIRVAYDGHDDLLTVIPDLSKEEINPNVKGGRSAAGVSPRKSSWTNALDTPPFEAYAVNCGITFTFGGVRITEEAQVLDVDARGIPGLYAAGEMVGGLFYFNDPGGTGLMSGAVFGRLAGEAAGRAAADPGRRA